MFSNPETGTHFSSSCPIYKVKKKNRTNQMKNQVFSGNELATFFQPVRSRQSACNYFFFGMGCWVWFFFFLPVWFFFCCCKNITNFKITTILEATYKHVFIASSLEAAKITIPLNTHVGGRSHFLRHSHFPSKSP